MIHPCSQVTEKGLASNAGTLPFPFLNSLPLAKDTGEGPLWKMVSVLSVFLECSDVCGIIVSWVSDNSGNNIGMQSSVFFLDKNKHVTSPEEYIA